MVFSSIAFLFFFFPVTAVLYYLCPNRFRNIVLLGASLFFYAWGEPVYVGIMVFSAVFDYVNGRLLERAVKLWKRKLILIVSVVGNLGILFFFKYFDYFIENINALTGSDWDIFRLALPIGISFYTFQTMSYTIDVFRGQVKAQHSLIDFAVYVCLFPQLIAGPIVRYRTIKKELSKRNHSFQMCYDGLCRFFCGLGKKVIFANTIGALWEEIRGSLGTDDMSVLMAWLGAVCFALQIYFDFSGYSDMAIGLGKFFGFHFPENFRYPYEAESITEFWRRWHISMSSWFRDYVYISLGGNRRGKRRQVWNLWIVWILTGLWHGASWNFVLWGMYYFIVLLIEKKWLFSFLERWPHWLRHVYSLGIIVVGWVVFAFEDAGLLLSYIKAMIGVHVPLVSSMGLYNLSTYGGFLIILSFGATSLPLKICRYGFRRKRRQKRMAAGVFTVFLFLLILPLLIRESYNPFLYFRF